MLTVKQKNNMLLVSDKIQLRSVNLEDVNNTYVGWMKDTEVNQYMETRFREQTQDTIAAYVENMLSNSNIFFFAMIDHASGNHIGNIKLKINQFHKRGEISLFIGERDFWGMGIATVAIELVRDFALNQLGLHKLSAGCYSNNIGSIRAFEKAGFKREAVLKEEYLFKDMWVDRYCYAFIASAD